MRLNAAVGYVLPHVPPQTEARTSSSRAVTSTGAKSVGGQSGLGHFHFTLRVYDQPPTVWPALTRLGAAYDAAMTTWWVYEDRTTHVAVVHHGWCPHCNEGQGQRGTRDERTNRWHGEYHSEAAARSADLWPGSMLRDCGTCMV